MVTRRKEAEALASLLEQASRAMHSLGFDSGLFPAQWTALRYFARVDPQQRTASALARFQGLAVGPVTRTVRTLVAKGLVENVAISGRGAAKQLDLTADGETLLDHDPIGRVVSSMAKLPQTERSTLATALETVLGDLHAQQVTARQDPARQNATRQVSADKQDGGREE